MISKVTPSILFLLLFAFRSIISLLTRSYIDPDEYWQSLEPAHWLVFGYGELTWEWRQGLRSWLGIAPFLLAYLPLRLLPDRHGFLLWLLPRLMQALIASTGDYYTIRLALVTFGESTSMLTIFTTCTSWYNAVYLTKMYSNALEATLVIMAAYFWKMGKYRRGALVAALGVVTRPSSACQLGAPFLGTLWRARQKRSFLRDSFLVGYNAPSKLITHPPLSCPLSNPPFINAAINVDWVMISFPFVDYAPSSAPCSLIRGSTGAGRPPSGPSSG